MILSFANYKLVCRKTALLAQLESCPSVPVALNYLSVKNFLKSVDPAWLYLYWSLYSGRFLVCFISAGTVRISLSNNNSPVVCTGLEKYITKHWSSWSVHSFGLRTSYTNTVWNSVSFAIASVKESAVCAHHCACYVWWKFLSQTVKTITLLHSTTTTSSCARGATRRTPVT